jgi:hypothetical protein
MSSEMVGGATGFSSSSSWMTPSAFLHTHLPRVSSNTKLFSSFRFAVGIFFLLPHMLPNTRPNNPGAFFVSPSVVAAAAAVSVEVGVAAAGVDAGFFGVAPAAA